MSVLRRVKLRTPDGIESIEYPLGVEAENVEVANQENLSQRLVRIDEDLEKNEEDIAAVNELAGKNKQNIGANEIRIDALERKSASVDEKPYYFDTVADMKAYQGLKEGDMAITLGYYEVNDGGNGEYFIKELEGEITDNQFYIAISNTNLIAKLIYDKPLDVRKIGFRSNGALISDTLRDGLLKENSFMFKDGTYRFNLVNLQNINSYNLYGDNAILTLESSFYFTTCLNIRIEGLKFDGSSANMIGFKDCQNVIIENNDFLNSTKIPVRMARTSGNICKNFKILNNNFIHVSATNAWGGAIYVDGQGKNSDSDTGFETNPIEEVEVKGNLFEEVGTGGVNFGGVKNSIVDGNIFKNAYGTQNMLMTCSRETSNLIVSNNTFKGCGWECCILHHCYNCTISDNYFEDFAYGVTIEEDSKDINISGNSFKGMKNNRSYTGGSFQTSTYGILLTRPTNVTVSNNNIDDCRHGILFQTSGVLVNVTDNLITNTNAGINIANPDTNNFNGVQIIGNTLKNVKNGISFSTRDEISISDNYIETDQTENSKGIQLQRIFETSRILINNNFIIADIGFDFTDIYNVDCNIQITNNHIEALSTPLKKYNFNVNCGNISWNNPDIILDVSNIATKFKKGSIVHYAEDNFLTSPSSGAAAISYYMANVENGVVFIMNNGTWKKKTGGGGSTLITTVDW